MDAEKPTMQEVAANWPSVDYERTNRQLKAAAAQSKMSSYIIESLTPAELEAAHRENDARLELLRVEHADALAELLSTEPV